MARTAVAGGALALAGAVVPVLGAGTAASTSLAPAAQSDATPAVSPPARSPALAGLTVPLPGGGLPAVLDSAGLADAVRGAQGRARLLADEARTRADGGRRDAEVVVRPTGDPDPDVDPESESESAAQDRRTAERARRAGRAAAPDPAPAAGTDCGLDTGRLGAVKTHVRTAAEILGCAFGKPEVLGIAGRGGPSDHPGGRALDFMVGRATGDALAACAVENREALGVSYVIWRQRIDTGSGFRSMEDRGSATANHFDHVHVSFDSAAGTGAPVRC